MCLNFFFSQCLRLDPENSNRTANHQGTFACIVDQNSGNQEWVIRGISSSNGDSRKTPGRWSVVHRVIPGLLFRELGEGR